MPVLVRITTSGGLLASRLTDRGNKQLLARRVHKASIFEWRAAIRTDHWHARQKNSCGSGSHSGC